MRARTPILLALFASLLALPAALTSARAEVYANDPGAKDPNKQAILALAQEFDIYAHAFDCGEFAWGQMSPDRTTATLEFVPPGDDVRKWTRLVTVTTLALPPSENERAAIAKRFQSIMLERISHRGRVIDTRRGTEPAGLPTLFVEYEIGEGVAKEHNAAAIIRFRPDLVGIIQIQMRGKALFPADIGKMRTLAMTMKVQE